MSFEDKLHDLFDNTKDITDTLWFTDTETLFDAIIRIHDEDIEQYQQETT